MKILVKYSGKKKRIIIDPSPDVLVSAVKNDIRAKFNLSFVSFRMLAIICDNFKILMTETFPIGFFNLGSSDYIEIEPYGYKLLANRKKSKNSTYLDTLGLSIKYSGGEHSIFDAFIEIIKRGNYLEFCETIEMFSINNPKEEILNKTQPNL